MVAIGGGNPELTSGTGGGALPVEDDEDDSGGRDRTETQDTTPTYTWDKEPTRTDETDSSDSGGSSGKDDMESDRAYLTRTGAEQEDDLTHVEGEDKTVVSGVDITGDEGEHGADGIASREQSRTSRTVTIIGTGEGEHGADGIAARENSAEIESPHTVTIDHSTEDESDEVPNPMVSPYAHDQTFDPEDVEPEGDPSEAPFYDPDNDGEGDDLITEPDWDGDGEEGGNLLDNDGVPNVPDPTDVADLLPWWTPVAVVGAVGTLLAVAFLWLTRPFVAAFTAAGGGS